MLLDYTSTQPIADQLKRLVMTQKPNAPAQAQERVYSLLHQFERAQWIPRLFEMLMQNLSGPGRFQDSADGLQYLGDEAATRAVANLLTAYLAMLDSLEMETQLYSTDEAAQYLGMGTEGLEWYLYKAPEESRITPSKRLQRGLVFTKETLDYFQEELRRGGGHRKSSDIK